MLTLLLLLAGQVPESPRFLHDDSVQTVAFAPDGQTIASAGIDRSIRLWKSATGELVREVGQHEGRIFALTFSPDGKQLASTSSDLKIHLWDPAAGKLVRTLHGHTDTIQAVAFSPDGTHLATAALDQTVRLWDPATGKVFRVIDYTEDRAPSLAFSADGKRVYVGYNPSPHVRGYDVTTGKEVFNAAVHKNGDLTCVVVAGRYLVVGTASGFLRRFDLEHSTEPGRAGVGGACLSLAASADGKLLLVGGSEGGIDLIETATLQSIRSFDCATVGFHVLDRLRERIMTRVRTVAFSTTAAFLVAGDQSGSLRVWRLLDLIPAKTLTASRLTDEELKQAVAGLSANESAEAFLSLARLGHYPEQALPALAARIKPPQATDEKQVRAWIAQLDDDEFEVRDMAHQKLLAIRVEAEAILRAALASKTLPREAARRVDELLEPLTRTSLEGGQLFEQRLVLLLQVLGTAESRKLLETLAAGAAGSTTTRDAKAALTRLLK